jgi:type I restriction enzyme M protein
MEACVVICRSRKTKERSGKVLFIDAVKEVARENAQSFLKPEHQSKILTAYQGFLDQPGFAYVATTDEVLAKDGDLSIPKYVEKVKLSSEGSLDLPSTWANFESDGRSFWTEMDSLVEMLDGVVAEEANDA